MKYQKIVIWRVFLPKTNCFSHPHDAYPPCVPVGPTFTFPVVTQPELEKQSILRASSRRHPHDASFPGGAAHTLATTLLLASSRCTPRDSRPHHVVRRRSPLLLDHPPFASEDGEARQDPRSLSSCLRPPPGVPPGKEAGSRLRSGGEELERPRKQGRWRRGAEGGRAPPPAAVVLCLAVPPRELPLLLHRQQGHGSRPPSHA
jgi:hypothetical protein